MKRSKRILALLLSMVLLFGMLPMSALAADSTFSDVKTSDWFYDDVRYVCENGLMSGTGSGTFSPKATTTRGMIVTILYRLSGEPAVSGVCPFGDVAAGKYYEKAITWAAENKIVSGYADGTFGPDNAIGNFVPLCHFLRLRRDSFCRDQQICRCRYGRQLCARSHEMGKRRGTDQRLR